MSRRGDYYQFYAPQISYGEYLKKIIKKAEEKNNLINESKESKLKEKTE